MSQSEIELCVEAVGKVLKQRHRQLTDVLTECLPDFKRKMVEKSLVYDACGENFRQIMQNFNSAWEWAESVEEVELRCDKFIHILKSFSGPSARAGEVIEKQLRTAVQEKIPSLSFLGKARVDKSNSAPPLVHVPESNKPPTLDRNAVYVETHSQKMSKNAYHSGPQETKSATTSAVQTDLSMTVGASSTPVMDDEIDGIKVAGDHDHQYMQAGEEAKDNGVNQSHISAGFSSSKPTAQNNALEEIIVGSTKTAESQIGLLQASLKSQAVTKDSGVENITNPLPIDISSPAGNEETQLLIDKINLEPNIITPRQAESGDKGESHSPGTTGNICIHCRQRNNSSEFIDYLKEQVRIKEEKLEEAQRTIQQMQSRRISDQEKEIEQLRKDKDSENKLRQELKIKKIQYESEKKKRQQLETVLLDSLKKDLLSVQERLSKEKIELSEKESQLLPPP